MTDFDAPATTDLPTTIPGLPGGTPPLAYGLAALLLLGGGVGAVRLFARPAPDVKAAPAALAVIAPTPIPVAAPPPPPSLEDLSERSAAAGATKLASLRSAPGKPGNGTADVAVAANPCSAACTGGAGTALTSSLRSAAQAAQGCYQRALRAGAEPQGRLTVGVKVGSDGRVCSASIADDTVGSPEVSSCVLARFRGRAFPSPAGGCVAVNIPIAFSVRQ